MVRMLYKGGTTADRQNVCGASGGPTLGFSGTLKSSGYRKNTLKRQASANNELEPIMWAEVPICHFTGSQNRPGLCHPVQTWIIHFKLLTKIHLPNDFL